MQGHTRHRHLPPVPLTVAVLLAALLAIIRPAPALAEAWDVGLGDTVYFGSYWQTPVTDSSLHDRIYQYSERVDDLRTLDGVTYRVKDNVYYRMDPIAWRVLADEGDTLLLLSDRVLDAREYDSGIESMWDGCGLRVWLNDYFMGHAFTEEERSYIPVSNNSYLHRTYDDWRTRNESPYATSSEQVFLLDYADIKAGLLDGAGVPAVAYSTPYLNSDERIRAWWLRGDKSYNYGSQQNNYIGTEGTVESWYPTYVRGIRPAIRVGKGAPSLTTEKPDLPGGDTGSDEDLTGRYISNFTSGEQTLWYASEYHEKCDSTGHKVLVPLTLSWDDGWFHADSTAYNHELARTSTVLAASAYDMKAYIPSGSAVDEENLAFYNMKKLGFDPNTFYYCYLNSDKSYEEVLEHENDAYGIDRVGFSIGVKWIDGGHTPLVAVLVRGTPQTLEWVSNFNVADSGEEPLHEGFNKAKRQVLDHLNYYLKDGRGKKVDLSKAIFLVTGHSRGAAVANLLGYDLDVGELSNETGQTDAARTYVYTFATPSGTTEASASNRKFTNIFNIVNPDDVVPKVALSRWGYGRYGVTKVLPSKSTIPAWNWLSVHGSMNAQFKKQTGGAGHKTYLLGAMTPNTLVNLLGANCPSVNKLYRPMKLLYFFDAPDGYSTDDLFKELAMVIAGKDDDYSHLKSALSELHLARPELTTALLITCAADPLEVAALLAIDGAILKFDVAPSLMHAHTSDTYIAWLLSSGADIYVDSYRGMKVSCPVDIKVYEMHDGNETLVCSIVNDEVDESVLENGLPATVVGETKWIDLPAAGEYRIEMAATDDGTMDIAFDDYDGEGNVTGQASWADLALVEGEVYEATVGTNEGMPLTADEVEIVNPNGEVVAADHVSSGDDLDAIGVNVSVGAGEGIANGPERATWGDQVSVYAAPADGYEFVGWYESSELVSNESEWTYRAEYDRTLEAHFAPVTEGPLSIESATVDPIEDQVHTYDQLEPRPTVRMGSKTLVEGVDYTLDYERNIFVGTATVVITGIGDYTGTKRVTFEIVEDPTPATAQEMYRLYNPNSGEHFYTAKAAERDFLVTVGWNYEGVGWTAPVKSETPVYRLYNEVAGDHHYTMKAGEKDFLVGQGWKYEGIGWYSDDAKGVPLYRQYNPNAVTGSHNYTTNKKENDFLVTHGWKGEGVGWYGVKQ